MGNHLFAPLTPGAAVSQPTEAIQAIAVQPLEDVAYSLMLSDRRSRVSPFVAQFAQLQENRLLVRIVG